jgi:hypothetical protein
MYPMMGCLLMAPLLLLILVMGTVLVSDVAGWLGGLDGEALQHTRELPWSVLLQGLPLLGCMAAELMIRLLVL